MSYAAYRLAVLRDNPMAFWPIGIGRAGGAASLYPNEAPRNMGGPLANLTGTNASGALSPRVPMNGILDPWVSSAADSMAATSANLNTDNLTVEVWIYMTTTGSPGDVYPIALADGGGGANPYTGIRYFSNNYEAFIGDQTGNIYDISRIPAIRGRWVHLVMTYHLASRRLLFLADGKIAGVQAAGGGGSRMLASVRIFVGRYNASFNFPWPAGSGVSCLSIYDRYDPSLADRHYRAAVGGHARGRR